jgi:mono/diheme cytochrome c family protein
MRRRQADLALSVINPGPHRGISEKEAKTMLKIHTILAVLAIGAIIDCGPIQAADVAHGETLARRWCATCHVVAPNQQRTTGEAPPFATIGRKPDFDVNRLTFFLLDPHPKMPNMSLTRTEAADIAAYIAALAR